MDAVNVLTLFEKNQVSTEIEAYLLGFFYADGCVSQYKYGAFRSFSISLNLKDIDYLQWICDTINESLATHYTVKSKANSVCRLTVCKKEFIIRLIKLGILPRKTYENSAFVFENIPNHLKHHFVRGFFDGDGTVGLYPNSKNNSSLKARVGFVSLNQKLLEAIRAYIKNNIGCSAIYGDSIYFRIRLGGNKSCLQFGNMIYVDAHYYLERKYLIFKEIPVYTTKNKYKGLSKYHNKVKVSINYGNTHHYIGLFSTVREAVESYNKEAITHGLEQQVYKGESLYEST